MAVERSARVILQLTADTRQAAAALDALRRQADALRASIGRPLRIQTTAERAESPRPAEAFRQRSAVAPVQQAPARPSVLPIAAAAAIAASRPATVQAPAPAPAIAPAPPLTTEMEERILRRALDVVREERPSLTMGRPVPSASRVPMPRTPARPASAPFAIPAPEPPQRVVSRILPPRVSAASFAGMQAVPTGPAQPYQFFGGRINPNMAARPTGPQGSTPAALAGASILRPGPAFTAAPSAPQATQQPSQANASVQEALTAVLNRQAQTAARLAAVRSGAGRAALQQEIRDTAALSREMVWSQRVAERGRIGAGLATAGERVSSVTTPMMQAGAVAGGIVAAGIAALPPLAEHLGGSFKLLAGEIGLLTIGPLVRFTAVLQGAARWVGNLSDSSKSAIGWTLAVTAGLGALGLAINTVIPAAAGVWRVLTGIWSAGTWLIGGFRLLTGATVALRTATTLAAASQTTSSVAGAAGMGGLARFGLAALPAAIGVLLHNLFLKEIGHAAVDSMFHTAAQGGTGNSVGDYIKDAMKFATFEAIGNSYGSSLLFGGVHYTGYQWYRRMTGQQADQQPGANVGQSQGPMPILNYVPSWAINATGYLGMAGPSQVQAIQAMKNVQEGFTTAQQQSAALLPLMNPQGQLAQDPAALFDRIIMAQTNSTVEERRLEMQAIQKLTEAINTLNGNVNAANAAANGIG